MFRFWVRSQPSHAMLLPFFLLVLIRGLGPNLTWNPDFVGAELISNAAVPGSLYDCGIGSLK